MTYDPHSHHRRSIRLKGYDYSQCGAYFVTLCTRNRECLFGEVVSEALRLNRLGRIVEETWEWLSARYTYVELDARVVMPNHLHGIIIIHDDGIEIGGSGRGGSRTAPIAPVRKPVGRLIGAFKTVSTKRISQSCCASCAQIWQRNYYEHIIRDEKSFDRIREYITLNPLRWTIDRDNPAVSSSGMEDKSPFDGIRNEGGRARMVCACGRFR